MDNKFVKLLIIIQIFCFVFCGCNYLPAPVEINDNTFISAIGIDKGIENKNNIRLTLISKDLESQSNGKSNESKRGKAIVIKYEAESFFEAIRQLHNTGNKDIFLGQIKFIVVGEELAKENIVSATDFLLRDHEVRLNVPILVSKGVSAEELLDSEEETKEYVSDTMKQLFKNIDGMSITKEITFRDAAIKLDSKISDAVLPSICKIKITGDERTHLKLDGYAVFNKFKLIGYLSDDAARGANFITDDIKSAALTVKDDEQNNITLEIISASSKIKPKYKDNNFEIDVEVKVNSNMDEIEEQKFVFTKDKINSFINQQAEIIKSNMESALKFSQENDVDIFGFSDKIYHKYPSKWKKIKDNWKDIYKNLKVNFKVDSNINKTYLIREQIGVEDIQK